jgi:beta-galactosidase
VKLSKGGHQIRATGRKGKTQVEDKISFDYQTEKWGKPAKLIVEKLAVSNDTATIQVKLMDDKNVQVLDSRDWVRFGIAGDGNLIDDLGTSSGSRYVQAYNGRAIIRVRTGKRAGVVSVTVEGIPIAFINL